MIAADYDEYSSHLSREAKSIIVREAAIFQIAWKYLPSQLKSFSITPRKILSSFICQVIDSILQGNGEAGLLWDPGDTPGACRSWTNPDAVSLQTRSHDGACVYISCPAVSTSSLVAVQASPQERRPRLPRSFPFLRQPEGSELESTFFLQPLWNQAGSFNWQLPLPCVWVARGLQARSGGRHVLMAGRQKAAPPLGGVGGHRAADR